MLTRLGVWGRVTAPTALSGDQPRPTTPGACSSHRGPQAYGLVGVRPHGPGPYPHGPCRRIAREGGGTTTAGGPG